MTPSHCAWGPGGVAISEEEEDRRTSTLRGRAGDMTRPVRGTLALGVPVGWLSIQDLGASCQYKSGTQGAFSPDIQLWNHP